MKTENETFPEMIRLFIATELSRGALGQVETWVEQLKGLDEWRLTAAENYHLTLKFLGATPIQQIPQMIEALQQIAQTECPFSVTLKGIGFFPNRRDPRVFWIGVEDPADRVSLLAQRLEVSLESLGFSRENRPYQPHVTVAKYRGGPAYPFTSRVMALIDSLESEKISFGCSEMKEIVLYESCTGQGISVYKVLARFPLGISPHRLPFHT